MFTNEVLGRYLHPFNVNRVLIVAGVIALKGVGELTPHHPVTVALMVGTEAGVKVRRHFYCLLHQDIEGKA